MRQREERFNKNKDLTIKDGKLSNGSMHIVVKIDVHVHVC